MKPGEKLLPKIEGGIKKSDFLLVLITKNSNKSPWVKKEIRISKAHELKKKKFFILPIVLNKCKVPPSLNDRLLIHINSNVSGIDKIIQSIFPDTFILEVHKIGYPFEIDKESLVEQLDEFCDLNKSRIHVWIRDKDLINNIGKVAKAVLLHSKTNELKSRFPLEFEEKYVYLDNALLYYNINLSILLSSLIENIFQHYTNKSGFIKTAVESIDNCIKFANYVLVGYLCNLLNSSNAEEFGYEDVASILSTYEKYYRVTFGSTEEIFIRNFFNVYQEELYLMDILGREDDNIQFGRFYLWNIDKYDIDAIWQKTSPKNVISDYKWYRNCIPQILSRHLWSYSFHSNTVVNQLENRIVMGLEEYTKIGFA